MRKTLATSSPGCLRMRCHAGPPILDCARLRSRRPHCFAARSITSLLPAFLVVLVVFCLGALHPALAGRVEFGTFGGWDTYRLDFVNPKQPRVNQLCAARGFYDGGYKMIFSIYNDWSVKLYLEHACSSSTG